MGLYFGIMVAVYAILSVQYLKTEEQGTRTEPVLSAAVGALPVARSLDHCERRRLTHPHDSGRSRYRGGGSNQRRG